MVDAREGDRAHALSSATTARIGPARGQCPFTDPHIGATADGEPTRFTDLL
jgi:hypothetical protein